MSNNNLPVATGDSLKTDLALATELQNADGMIPKAFVRAPGKILAAILTGRELGVGPMAALRAFHIVEGKPCADYSFWIARLKAAGYRIEWSNCTAKTATLTLTAPDGSRHVETWTEARAIAAGLWGKNTWKSYPDTMLKARCVTSAGRAFAAEVMFGCYETDEAEELRTVDATVTATEPTKAAGVAALATKLGLVETPKTDGPQPFAGADAVGEALAAIHSCGSLDAARAVRDRLAASKLGEEGAQRAKHALAAKVEELKAAPPADPEAAAERAAVETGA
jgi:hypothetical protein